MVSVRSWGFQFILNAIKAHFSSLCVAFHHTHGVLMRWMFCQQTEEYLQMCFVCWSIAMKGCWCCSVFFFFPVCLILQLWSNLPSVQCSYAIMYQIFSLLICPVTVLERATIGQIGSLPILKTFGVPLIFNGFVRSVVLASEH